MKLKILLPGGVLLDEEVKKVIVEAVNGSFCILPHHIDIVSALVPGILTFVTTGGHEASPLKLTDPVCEPVAS